MDFGVESINEWSDFEKLQENIYSMKSGFIFRGQSNAAWGLVPSIHRLVPPSGGIESIKDAEEDLQEQFRRRSHLDFSPSFATEDAGKFGTWWPLMQHHGVPTRLLDWTASPYVALYFAVHNASSTDPKSETDGNLWVLNSTQLKKLNLSAMVEWASQESNRTMELLFETAMFEDKSVPNVLIGGSSMLSSEREVLQQGSFTFSISATGTHEDAISSLIEANKDSAEPTVARIKIAASIKTMLRARLRSANISAATLFPGMDGVR